MTNPLGCRSQAEAKFLADAEGIEHVRVVHLWHLYQILLVTLVTCRWRRGGVLSFERSEGGGRGGCRKMDEDEEYA